MENDNIKKIREIKQQKIKEKIQKLAEDYKYELNLAMQEIETKSKKKNHSLETIRIAKDLKDLNAKLTIPAIKRLEKCVLFTKENDLYNNIKLITDLYLKNEEHNSALKLLNYLINNEPKCKSNGAYYEMRNNIKNASTAKDVEMLLDEGKTTAEIAEKLGKSEIDIIRIKNTIKQKDYKKTENEDFER